MPPDDLDPLACDLAATPDEVLAAIGAASEIWGGEWSPDGRRGRLAIPCQRGLRRGYLIAQVEVSASSGGSTVELRRLEEEMLLNTPAVIVLALAAGGGVATALWPFVPALLPVLPLATVLALGGWFLVASRSRTLGPVEFLAEVDATLGAGDPGSPSAGQRESAAPANPLH